MLECNIKLNIKIIYHKYLVAPGDERSLVNDENVIARY